MKSHNKHAAYLGLCFALIGLFASDRSLGADQGQAPTHQAVLQRLNGLGQSEYDSSSYRFEISSQCNLLVTKLITGNPAGHSALSLADTRFELFKYAVGLGYAVRVANILENTVVFESKDIGPAEEVLRDLDFLSEACKQDATRG